MQGYTLGFFPKFRQRKGIRETVGQRTHMLLSLSRPQGGACCGLSSLRLSSELPQQLATAGSLPLPPQRKEPLQEYQEFQPLLPAHHGLGSSNFYFPYNPERDNWDKGRKSFYAQKTSFLERLTPSSKHHEVLPICSQPPFQHLAPLFSSCLIPTSPQSPVGLLTSILHADSDYSHTAESKATVRKEQNESLKVQ